MRQNSEEGFHNIHKRKRKKDDDELDAWLATCNITSFVNDENRGNWAIFLLLDNQLRSNCPSFSWDGSWLLCGWSKKHVTFFLSWEYGHLVGPINQRFLRFFSPTFLVKCIFSFTKTIFLRIMTHFRGTKDTVMTTCNFSWNIYAMDKYKSPERDFCSARWFGNRNVFVTTILNHGFYSNSVNCITDF